MKSNCLPCAIVHAWCGYHYLVFNALYLIENTVSINYFDLVIVCDYKYIHTSHTISHTHTNTHSLIFNEMEYLPKNECVIKNYDTISLFVILSISILWAMFCKRKLWYIQLKLGIFALFRKLHLASFSLIKFISVWSCDCLNSVF